MFLWVSALICWFSCAAISGSAIGVQVRTCAKNGLQLGTKHNVVKPTAESLVVEYVFLDPNLVKTALLWYMVIIDFSW